MAHVQVCASLLVVSLSAAVSSGCTRIDSRLSEQRWNDQRLSPPETLQVTAESALDHDEVELPSVTPEPTIDELFVPEIASPSYAEVESVLDELDSALLTLEHSLGSTEYWDVTLP
jgi:hypothetical protein